jgi:DnaK suppressor protein
MKAKPAKVKSLPKTAKVLTPTKPVAKALAKSPAKPVLKTKVKPGVKTKPAVKTPPAGKARPVAKAPAKPQVKKVLVKAPAKAALHASPARPKVKVKVAVKVAQATLTKAVKQTAKVKPKDSVNTTIAKAPKPQLAVAKPQAAPAASSANAVPVAPVSVPVRAGRPSSRLAQLTVPSMAQSVASTAAKASFTQTLVSPQIVPPLASTVKKDPKLTNNWKSKSLEQLTDAELIAMPDSEYMNETQMAFFRRRLVQLKKDILSNAGETTEHLREDTVVVPDPADRATIEEEHALELRTRDRERKLLKKIEQSIARIDSGDYGYCDETGEPIGVGRLLARPTANLSLEAQQRRELKQKMFGD